MALIHISNTSISRAKKPHSYSHFFRPAPPTHLPFFLVTFSNLMAFQPHPGLLNLSSHHFFLFCTQHPLFWLRVSGRLCGGYFAVDTHARGKLPQGCFYVLSFCLPQSSICVKCVIPWNFPTSCKQMFGCGGCGCNISEQCGRRLYYLHKFAVARWVDGAIALISCSIISCEIISSAVSEFFGTTMRNLSALNFHRRSYF